MAIDEINAKGGVLGKKLEPGWLSLWARKSWAASTPSRWWATWLRGTT